MHCYALISSYANLILDNRKCVERALKSFSISTDKILESWFHFRASSITYREALKTC